MILITTLVYIYPLKKEKQSFNDINHYFGSYLATKNPKKQKQAFNDIIHYISVYLPN